jgi:hypothetical protein
MGDHSSVGQTSTPPPRCSPSTRLPKKATSRVGNPLIGPIWLAMSPPPPARQRAPTRDCPAAPAMATARDRRSATRARQPSRPRRGRRTPVPGTGAAPGGRSRRCRGRGSGAARRRPSPRRPSTSITNRIAQSARRAPMLREGGIGRARRLGDAPIDAPGAGGLIAGGRPQQSVGCAGSDRRRRPTTVASSSSERASPSGTWVSTVRWTSSRRRWPSSVTSRRRTRRSVAA